MPIKKNFSTKKVSLKSLKLSIKKTPIGVARKVFNKERDFGESLVYVIVAIDGVGKKGVEPLMLTAKQYQDAVERAKANPEDVSKHFFIESEA